MMNGSIPRRWTLGTALLALAGLHCPGYAAAVPLISEVMYDASGTDNGFVFVELYGSPGTALDGLTLEGVNGADGNPYLSAALSGTFPADGLFVIGDDDGTGATSVPGADLIVNFDPQNGPDSIRLRSDTTVLDAIGYGTFGAGDVFAGEGTPASVATNGKSLARMFANVDTDDNFADFAVLDTPTPGLAQVQVSAVPLPASLWMLGSGAAVLFARVRKRPTHT